jgi:MFS family permease
MNGTFRSLAERNYRVWASGAIVSNIGTWMQRTAQDWLVLTQLTHNNATALGIVTALQFGPQLLLFAFTGPMVDRFSRRGILILTQLVMGILALGLGVLTVTHLVVLWEVYVFALLLGVAAAFDAPARQAFVNELVVGKNLSNAVALNATSFNVARMIGPAIAGLLIALIGTGWVFLANSLTFAGVLLSLRAIRESELHLPPKKAGPSVKFADGLKYAWNDVQLRTILICVFLIGTFGLNFPIFLSTMNVSVFHADSFAYGLLSTVMAAGSVAGALLAAQREKPRIALMFGVSAGFALGCALAAVMPSYWPFALSLVIIGITAQTFNTTANSLVQLSAPAHLRGRIMAIYLAVLMGGTPIGAPLVGWVADTFGPRWALGVAAASGLVTALILLGYLVRVRNLHVGFAARRVHVEIDPTQAISIVTQEVAVQKPEIHPVPQVAKSLVG